MNRKIKFRAWDSLNSESNNGKMHYFNSMQVCDNGLWFNNNDFDLGENHCDDENAFVMQHTGLKDKNGKEIYEGDIVETDHSPNSKPERLRRIVVFHDGSFRTQRSLSSTATDMNNMHSKKVHATNLLVIGNIYEHPHLMSGSNAV